MALINIVKLVLQAICKREDFLDSAKCREFVKAVLAVARSVTEKNTLDMDEKILDQIDQIVGDDTIWNYVYNLVLGWFTSDTDNDEKPAFEVEGGATSIVAFIPLLIQIWKIIRIVKRLNAEG